MSVIYLGAGMLLMMLAHMARAYRWGLFISVYEKPDKGSLLRAIVLGYLANYVVPFKLGDVLRAYYASRRIRNGKALALSTVIADRVLDIIIVGIVFLCLAFSGRVNGKDTVGFYIAGASAILMIGFLVYFSRVYIKKAVILFARLFNVKIEGALLRFSFSLISDMKNMMGRIPIISLIVSTTVMWGGYIASYYAFAIYSSTAYGINQTWIDVFTSLFSESGVLASTGRNPSFGLNSLENLSVGAICFHLIPLLLIWCLSYLVYSSYEDTVDKEPSHFVGLLPHMDLDERLAFLESYFSNDDKEYIESYLNLNRDITIIRDYSAGSKAATMLCMDGDATFFRKYAFGKELEKLYDQIEWIKKNSGMIPLPEVLRQGKTDTYCFYDMPYQSHSVGLFEYVHSMPIENGWRIIKDVLECMESSLYKTNVRMADKDTIDQYISEKVVKNLKRLKDSKYINGLCMYDNMIINGVEYQNLKAYLPFLSREYLGKVFEGDTYSVIHGDLTIENIICTRSEDGKNEFYIIDPNTGNIHDSPNLDYGKLLQSIHGGYEFLMSTKDVAIHGNHIDFLFTRSSAYRDLHLKLKDYMLEKFGYRRTRSIYFHEMIHWLRLMPYKIEKDDRRSVLFYAGMLIVMNDVIKEFGNNDGQRQAA